MDFNELRLFNHLAGTLHYGKTSRACNISPSALSRTIVRLEEEVGHKLFYRDNRSVELTDTGKIDRLFSMSKHRPAGATRSCFLRYYMMTCCRCRAIVSAMNWSQNTRMTLSR